MSDIKVGSEWIDKYGTKVVVKYIGTNILTYQYDNIENSARPERFLTFHTPAPVRRTVWLNVYEDEAYTHRTKQGADKARRPDMLYQQEVDLIDPRDGGTKA